MCTAISFLTSEKKCYFGRNMDLEYSFNQCPILIPKETILQNTVSQEFEKCKKTVIGMGTIIDSHPALAEGFNENGLACAGLNFEGFAHFDSRVKGNKTNVSAADFILWVLQNCSNVTDAEEKLKQVNIINAPLNGKTPCPQLHWILCDKSGKSIVVEKTKQGLSVLKNPVGVLSNNPEFNWHLTNLNSYLKVSSANPREKNWSGKKLSPFGFGFGTVGLSGGFDSVSRFVRAAYLRANMPTIKNETLAVSHLFKLLDNVAVPKGAVVTKEKLKAFTIYSCCMDLSKGVYYYKSYTNSRINALKLKSEESEIPQIKQFEYIENQDINFQNH